MFCAGRSAAELDTWFHSLDPLFLFVLDSSLPTRLDSFLCAYLRFFSPCFPKASLPAFLESFSLFPSPWVVPFLLILLQLERPFLAWILPSPRLSDSPLFPSLWSFEFDFSWNDASSCPSTQHGRPFLPLLWLLHHSCIKILDPPHSAVAYRSTYHLSLEA